MNNLKIALFHPWLKSRGGAERVVLEFLKNTKHNVEVYTWVYNKEKTFKEFENFKIKVIAPKIARRFSRTFLLRGLIPLLGLYQKIPLEKYDYFFISTSGVAEMITFRNYKPGRTYAYVHTILRASYKDIIEWNLRYRYKNPLIKAVYLSATKIYRLFEKLAWKRIDVAIFNSELSLERAKKHKLLDDKDTFIVYPPVDVERFKKLKIKNGNYFLYVSRFNLPKRQDVLLDAWFKFSKKYPNYKLLFVGNVDNEKYFKKLKKKAEGINNVRIETDVSDDELLKYYSNCLGVVFVPFIEDFGITPFEVLAAGKPLIATDNGGFVKLIEGLPQFFKINEKYAHEPMAEEIAKTLEKFVKTKKKAKKIIIKDVDSKKFVKDIEQIFKNARKLKK